MGMTKVETGQRGDKLGRVLQIMPSSGFILCKRYGSTGRRWTRKWPGPLWTRKWNGFSRKRGLGGRGRGLTASEEAFWVTGVIDDWGKEHTDSGSGSGLREVISQETRELCDGTHLGEGGWLRRKHLGWLPASWLIRWNHSQRCELHRAEQCVEEGDQLGHTIAI